MFASLRAKRSGQYKKHPTENINIMTNNNKESILISILHQTVNSNKMKADVEYQNFNDVLSTNIEAPTLLGCKNDQNCRSTNFNQLCDQSMPVTSAR